MSVSSSKKRERSAIVSKIKQESIERTQEYNSLFDFILETFTWLVFCLIWSLIVATGLYLITLITSIFKFNLVFVFGVGVIIGSYKYFQDRKTYS